MLSLMRVKAASFFGGFYVVRTVYDKRSGKSAVAHKSGLPNSFSVAYGIKPYIYAQYTINPHHSQDFDAAVSERSVIY